MAFQNFTHESWSDTGGIQRILLPVGIVAAVFFVAFLIIWLFWSTPDLPESYEEKIAIEHGKAILKKAETWTKIAPFIPYLQAIGTITVVIAVVFLLYKTVGIRYLTSTQVNLDGTQMVNRIPIIRNTLPFIRQLGTALVENASSDRILRANEEARALVETTSHLVKAFPHPRYGARGHYNIPAEVLPYRQDIALPPHDGNDGGGGQEILWLRDIWNDIPQNQIWVGEPVVTERAFHQPIKIFLKFFEAESIAVAGRTNQGKSVFAGDCIVQQLRNLCRISIIDEHYHPIGRNPHAMTTRIEGVLPLVHSTAFHDEVYEGKGLAIFREFEAEYHRRVALPPRSLADAPIWYLWLEEYSTFVDTYKDEGIKEIIANLLRVGRKFGLALGLIAHEIHKRHLPFHQLIQNRIVFSSDKDAAHHLLQNKKIAQDCLDMKAGEARILNTERYPNRPKFQGYYYEPKELRELLPVPQEVRDAYEEDQLAKQKETISLQISKTQDITEYWRMAESSKVVRARLNVLSQAINSVVSYPKIEAMGKTIFKEDSVLTLSQIKKFMSLDPKVKPKGGFSTEFIQQLYKVLWQTDWSAQVVFPGDPIDGNTVKKDNTEA